MTLENGGEFTARGRVTEDLGTEIYFAKPYTSYQRGANGLIRSRWPKKTNLAEISDEDIEGSMTTAHSNSPRDLLSRLEVMVLMSGMDLPVRVIREQIASAVDIIVHQSRFSDGRRRVTSIVEVDGMEEDVVLMQKLFEFRQSSIDADGRLHGEFKSLGIAPRFYTELQEAGVELDRSIFMSTANETSTC